MTGFRVPTATYRLQFHHGFRFIAAQALVPYLQALGISDIYASPLFRARKRSLHGYSVTNPLEINPELGSRVSFNALARVLTSQGMGLILDIVPNHMAMSHDNPWWIDVLENGPASPYSIFFDVDWHPPNKLLEGRVLQPILGDPYDQVLENREIRLVLGEGGFRVCYYDHEFPLDPKTYPAILTYRRDSLRNEPREGNFPLESLDRLISLLEYLPPRTDSGKKKLKHRNRQKEVLKRNLWSLYREHPPLQEFIQENIGIFQGQKGDPESFNLLDDLLRAQPYRLAHWRVTLDMINYRRFFSINDLIGLRVEDPQVFEASHSLLFSLVREGRITGLRIDHIDGLYDPLEYLERLQRRLPSSQEAPEGHDHLFVVVEKILGEHESLPPQWPVAGTTGYDFLRMANGLFVDPQGLEELQHSYAKLVRSPVTLPDIVPEKKKLVMASLFGGEVETLGHQLSLLAALDRRARDIPRQDLYGALEGVIACLPVYRTYIRNFEVSPADRAFLEQALEEARQRYPTLNPRALEFLQRVLLLEMPAFLSEEQKQDWLRFVMRWQQFTGPIMAKGLEDTALYVYNPLISLNEVGGSFQAVTPEAFHRFNQVRLQYWPFSLNATSTHDTKRSEDVRMRLQVLSEKPTETEACLRHWMSLNESKKLRLNGRPVPDPFLEIHLYQTMLGAWPLSPAEVPEFRPRLRGYLIKAAREAKVHTRWISPNPDYERALLTFLEGILEESAKNEFLQELKDFQEDLAFCGALNSLSQVLLKIASPGVPDFYQGSELWDFSLVDPDNRRPVDFQKRAQFLNTLKLKEPRGAAALVAELLSHWQDGAIKLFITYKALNCRKTLPDLFSQGGYLPLAVEGDKKAQVLAFARQLRGTWVIAAVGRFFTKIVPPKTQRLNPEVWRDSMLILPPEAPRSWHHIFTGETISSSSTPASLPLQHVFPQIPVALMYSAAAWE